jgi:hypothetical protein
MMVFCTAKIRWRELSAGLTLLAAFLLCLWGGQSRDAAQVSLLSARPQETAPLDYLQSLGWEVTGEPVCDQVLMPDSFGEEYNSFLALQKQGGFDLTSCAGQTVTRYSFTLSNYPTGENGILADVMVLDGRIVGGEIRSPDLDGFMRALVARDQIQ